MTKRFARCCLILAITGILLIFPVFPQIPPPAEAQIKALVDAGDVQGLAAYALQIVAVYRETAAQIEQQRALIAELEAARGRQQVSIENALAGIQDLRTAIQSERAAVAEERAAREKLQETVAGLGQRSRLDFLSTTAMGASFGANLQGTGRAGAIGAGVGLIMESLIQKRFFWQKERKP